MKFLFDLFPVILFFIAFKVSGIYVATGVAIVATFAQIGWLLARGRKVDTMLWVSLAIIVVFGGATLWLQDDHFIKIKPTMVNGLFAAILFVGLATGRLFLKIVFGEVMRLTDQGWRILTFRWAFFFVFLAGLNEVMWRFFSTDTWVAFKVFGIMPITFIFALCQIGILKKYEDTTSEST